MNPHRRLMVQALVVLAMGLYEALTPRLAYAVEQCNAFCWYDCNQTAYDGCHANGASNCNVSSCIGSEPCGSYGLQTVLCGYAYEQ
jgi:hypothetical protein